MHICIRQSFIDGLRQSLCLSKKNNNIRFSEGDLKRRLSDLRDRIGEAAEKFGLNHKIYETVVISGTESKVTITADRRGNIIILYLEPWDIALSDERNIWHELGHIADIMTNETFQFDVALQHTEPSEICRVIVYIWNVCLDARLNQSEIKTYSKENRRKDFCDNFPKMSDSKEKFEWLWSNPHLTHPEIVEWARKWKWLTKATDGSGYC